MIGNPLLLGDEGYQIQRSLRLRSSASAYLSRTPASTTNQKTWTWSGWVKRGQLSGSADFTLFGSVNPGVSQTTFSFSNDGFVVSSSGSGLAGINLKTSAVFRDTSAWYHIIVAVDTTQATDTNRVKIYINGVQSTSFSASTYPTQNTNCTLNVSGLEVNIARFNLVAFFQYFDGYLAEINFIDGQALTPSSFGAINPVTGVWSATKYAGTYGTNGFYLNFSDNSAATATTIGKDYSGNGNNWTPNNISVTAGVTYDSMLDVPLGAGGAERGNYCVLSPLATNTVGVATLTNGNLTFSIPNTFTAIGSMSATSGKYYWEAIATSNPVGVGLKQVNVLDRYSNTIYYMGSSLSPSGEKYVNGTGSAYGASWTTGDVIGVAVDMDGGTVTFYKNNASQGSIALSTASITEFVPSFVSGAGVTFAGSVNFGQRPFAYTPPSGFKALHTGNLAAPVIALPAQYMAATLYTGNGSTQTVNNSGGFYPDFNWIKSRSNAGSHVLVNSVAGGTKQLFSNLTDAEQTNTNITNGISSSGIALGNNSAGTGSTNQSAYTYVLWQWLAGGGSAVTNTAGSITSSVSANTTAGFSVVTYTGNATAGATVGHGLGVAPNFVIAKPRSTTGSWIVGCTPIGWGNQLALESTGASTAYGGFSSTAPSSTVITLGNNGSINGSGTTFVAYCFAPVAGYSAFGSYTGNGSADGPFVYLGFRPRYVMIKRTDSTGNWEIHDTARASYNADALRLWANLASAEDATEVRIDELSNGFKLRSGAGDLNASGGTYIFMAFAENPFKNSLAR